MAIRDLAAAGRPRGTGPPGALSPRRSTAWRVGFALVGACCFAVATGLVLHDLSVGHNLYGLDEYDDGVYFGAAMHFVAGQLPYRDFVFVQPPGITVVLAPIALAVGHGDPRLGIAIARVLTGVTIGVDAALVVWILRRRGLLAALLGGMAFAIFPPGVTADRTLMLEPYLIFFCLLAIALAFSKGEVASDRRLVAAGLALGFAASIKLFAAALAIAFALSLAWRHRRALLLIATGALAAFVLCCLPFAIGAPHAFVSEVFGSQFSRSSTAPAPIELRIATVTGLAYSTSRSALPIGPGAPWPWVAGGLLFAVSFVGTVVPGLRRRLRTESWCMFIAAYVAFLMILIPRQYYDHYAEIAMAFFVIVVGGVLGSVTEAVRGASARRRAHDPPPAGARRPVGLAAGGLVLAALTLSGSAIVLHAETSYEEPKLLRYADPGPGLERAIPAGACVISDATSLLVIANRMNFSSSCPVIVDATGTWLTYDPVHPPQRNRREPKDPALVALWRAAFARVDYAVFAGNAAFRVPFTPALTRWFNDHFARMAGVAPITFERRPHPIADAPPVPGAVP